MMKVIAINGSPRKNGNTATVLEAMAQILEAEGIGCDIIPVGGEAIHGCTACGYCKRSPDNQCVIENDCVNDIARQMRQADGLILASPTYYGGIAGTMKSFLDRAFYTSSSYFAGKVATAVTVVRRTGGLDALHGLHNYLLLSQTVLAPSQYWTVVHGADKGEVLQDAEGMQTAKMNARAMAWLLHNGAAANPFPPLGEPRARTNFIR